jgi:intein/homing endonuclease
MEMNLEHVMNSKEFKSLYKNISENNSPLAVLPDEQRKIITYLYLSKNETLINGLTDALYRTKVPSIEDFMNIHMGEFGSNIFPKWRECLTDVFAPNSQVFELIFGGCVTGDTKVKLLNGEDIPIKELAENNLSEPFYVYSFNNETKEVVPGKAYAPRLTTKDAKIVRVTLDDGSSIRCTDDHRFMLRNGNYKPAGKLLPGESLMPCYTKLSEKKDKIVGYRKVYQPATDKYEMVHKLVARWKNGIMPNGYTTVHHKDFSILNNDPSNLLVTTFWKHREYHWKSEAKNGNFTKLWKDPERRKKLSEIIRQNAIKNNQNPEIRKKQVEGWKKSNGLRKFIEQTIEFNKNSHPNLRSDITLEKVLQEAPSCTGISELSERLKCSRQRILNVFNDAGLNCNDYTAKTVKRSPYARLGPRNHKVVSVEECGYEDVYDLSVEKYHNFAVSDNSEGGIFIHNSIGAGKSAIGLTAQIYNLIRVLYLRNPQQTLGVPSITLLYLMMISITLDKGKFALMGQLVSLIEGCDLFVSVDDDSEFEDVMTIGKIPYWNQGSALLFPHKLRVIYGSNTRHALSYALVGALLDEAEFRIGGTAEAIEVYTNLKERVRSRFLDSYKYVLLTLISSAKYTTGVIADTVKNLKKDDPHTRYFAFPIWEIKSFNSYKAGYFYVIRGTRSNPSKILNDVERDAYEKGVFECPPNCEVIKVPQVYYNDFNRRLEEALQNLAGLQTFGVEFLFDDLRKIEHDDLLGEITLSLRLGEKQDVISMLPSSIFIKIGNNIRLARYPQAIRYLHLDLAETSEAGIAMLHKELGDNGETIYVTDFVLRIITSTRIDLDAILNFIINLREKVEVHFGKVSADQFQSAYILQMLKTAKVTADPDDIKLVSVDRTIDPYRQFSNAVYYNVFHTGKCPLLRQQMSRVVEDEGKPTSDDRKDISDSTCGAIHNAIMNTKDVPIYPRTIKHPTSEEMMRSIFKEGKIVKL